MDRWNKNLKKLEKGEEIERSENEKSESSENKSNKKNKRKIDIFNLPESHTKVTKCLETTRQLKKLEIHRRNKRKKKEIQRKNIISQSQALEQKESEELRVNS